MCLCEMFRPYYIPCSLSFVPHINYCEAVTNKYYCLLYTMLCMYVYYGGFIFGTDVHHDF